MEEGHDKQRPVFGGELVCCSYICQASCKVALIQRHSLWAAGGPAGVEEERHIVALGTLKTP